MNVPGTIALSALDRVRLEAAVDQGLRDRLKKDAAAVLAERGIEIPGDVKVNVVEDTMDSHTITLPPFVGSDTSQASLQAQVGANPATWACTTCTPTTPICAGSLASLICLGGK